MRLPLGDAWPHRQDRPGPVQGLDLGLLIHADNDRVLRWCQVEAHDVADLGFELRIGGELEPLGAVRLQTELPPQDRDRVMADADALRPAQPLRQPPARPMRHARCLQGPRGRGHGRDEDLAHHLIGQHRLRPAWTWRVLQPGQPGLGILAAPLDDRRLRATRTLSDLRAGQPIRSQQHDPGPLHDPGRGPFQPGPPLQFRPVTIRHRQHAHAIRHTPLSRTLDKN